MKIACCVSDATVYQRLCVILRHTGAEVTRFSSEIALLRAQQGQDRFDLILVDIASGSSSRAGILSWLRIRSDQSIPVVLLAQSQDPEWAALLLDAGAEDFIQYPVHPAEFLSRLSVVLRRASRLAVCDSLELLGFWLDRKNGQIFDRGKHVELTRREFAMAWLFFSSPGVYFSRNTISIAIWGVNRDIANRTIEQHVYKLRKKLKLGVERGLIIRAAYTQGYRLELLDGDETFHADVAA
jgi:DNA-binding response OmpR family regulator